jgi:hypothetical protein
MRYVYDDRQINQQGYLKYQAFMPSNRDGKLSTYRKANRSDEMIWLHANSIRSDKEALARGELQVQRVIDVGLQLDPDDDPPGHVNIEGWPQERDKQMLFAQKMVAIAEHIIR